MATVTHFEGFFTFTHEEIDYQFDLEQPQYPDRTFIDVIFEKNNNGTDSPMKDMRVSVESGEVLDINMVYANNRELQRALLRELKLILKDLGVIREK